MRLTLYPSPSDLRTGWNAHLYFRHLADTLIHSDVQLVHKKA
uniref:Uncharacterized protein n=1 Tax=Anguilla anguilla TaxID=7936 RepID=A0A0E9R4D9_ANGAN